MGVAETIRRPAAGRPRRGTPDVEIGICLGTGGIAAGGDDVFAAFQQGLKDERGVRRGQAPRRHLRGRLCLHHRHGLPWDVRHGCAGRCHHAHGRAGADRDLRHRHSGHGGEDHRGPHRRRASRSTNGSYSRKRSPLLTTSSISTRIGWCCATAAGSIPRTSTTTSTTAATRPSTRC